MSVGGVVPQKIMNLVDVFSCILMHFWDGQLEKGNTYICSGSKPFA